MEFQDIAQQIVDDMMEFTEGRLINIMNEQGYIIASGDKQRINTYHQGAYEVTQTKKPVYITQQTVSKYKGSKQGVNLPIEVKGSLIGVVGIHGNPEEVHITAKLIKRTIELIIEQQMILNQFTLRKNMSNQFIKELTTGNVEKRMNELMYLADAIQLNLSHKRSAIVIQTNEKCNNHFKVMSEIELKLIGKGVITKEDISGYIDDKLVCYILFVNAKRKECINEIRKELAKKGIEIYIGIGMDYAGLDGYKRSYEEALSLVCLEPLPIMDLQEIEVKAKYILSKIDQQEIEPVIQPIYINLLDKDSKMKPWCYESMCKLFENNLDVAKAANSLDIHKNTLLYRMRKIESITQLSFQNFYHTVLLYMIYKKYKKNKF